MRIIVAIMVPWLAFFSMQRNAAGFLCLFLQLTIIAWPVAIIWSLITFSQHKQGNRKETIEKQLRDQRAKQIQESWFVRR